TGIHRICRQCAAIIRCPGDALRLRMAGARRIRTCTDLFADAPGREELNMRKSLLVLVAAMSALLSAALYAHDYPSRTVTIVNVFGPGGGSDTVCRIIANKLGPALG